MVVLGIYGSPRKGGNTDLMMDAFLEGAAGAGGEPKRIYVRNHKIYGCLECAYCDQKGQCVQEDDMIPIYPLMEEVPRVVVASPVFFYGVTGQLKLLIDRSQASFMKKELEKKAHNVPRTEPQRRGFLLSAGATRGKRLFECVILTAKYFFDAINVQYAGDLCFREIEDKGAISLHPTALEECRKAGKAFVADVDQA
jgi:multimeric flavodoxin WrbA